jgi:murein DD-endopeptidase MepM/ murein hydrolase activator NlpD
MSGKKTLLASSIGVCTASAATAVAWAGSTDSHPVTANLLTQINPGWKISLDAQEILYQSGKQLTISIGNTLTHEVSKGDTLYQIGLQHGVHYQELAQLNNIENPHKLPVGTKLKIPLAIKELTAKGGEMAYQLCRDNKMSLQLFLKLNSGIHLLSPLGVGQKVFIVEKETVPIHKPLAKKNAKSKIKNKVVLVSKQEKVSLGNFQFQWPVTGMITSNFGWRHGRMHKGLDIWSARKAKQEINASLSGKVTQAGYDGGYGNLVKIDHGDGWVTIYAHLSRITVGVGQIIETGQKLGYMGETGNATGYHLHFEVLKRGEAINPLRVLH